MQFKWIFVGLFPLMTKRGHFIINGVPRVIINQAIRQSGIYHQQITSKLIKSNKIQIEKRFYVDLISQRGTWLRLEIDKKKKIWARMKKIPRIPALLLLQSVGLNKKIIIQTLFNLYFLSEGKSQSPYKFLIDFTSIKKKNTENLIETSSRLICRKFLNPQSYDLGKGGRHQLNNKLGLSIPLNRTTLTPYDLLWSVDSLIQLFNNQKNFDDIDHLKNRRIRTSGELIQNQLNLGLIRLEKKLIEKLKKSKGLIKIHHIFTSRPVNSVFKEFFGSNPLSQFLDQANPLSELTHKRRLTSVGPGGINRDTAGMAIRGIHPTHYGRICPIETPEGQNAGLVNSLTAFASLTDQGFIQTPLFLVYKGQTQKKLGAKILSSRSDKNLTIALNNIKTSKLNFLPNLPLTIQSNQLLKKLYRKNINFIIVSCLQLISTATSLIPFLEHNDANRALMGSNMQRQAVPLVSPQRPIIGTSFENKVLFYCGNFLQSNCSGLVLYSSHKRIKILSSINYRKEKYKQPLFAYFNNSFLIGEYKKRKFVKLIIIKNYLTRLVIQLTNIKLNIFYFYSKKSLKKINYNTLYKYYRKKLTNFCFQKSLVLKKNNFKNFRVCVLVFINKFYKLKNIYLNKNFLLFNKNKAFNSNLKNFDTLIKLKNTKKSVLPHLNIKNFFQKRELIANSNTVQFKILFKNYIRSNQGTCLIQKPTFHSQQWVEKGDLLTNNFSSQKSELALGQNVLVAYLSWEGYNFEDALLINERLVFNDIYTSLHIEKYKIEARETPFGFEQITGQIPDSEYRNIEFLDERGIIKIGSWVEEGDVLVGRVTPIRQRNLLPHEKLLYDIVGKEISSKRDTSLRVPRGIKGRVIDHKIYETKNIFENQFKVKIKSVYVYILEYKKIKIGDKIAGRHGNKGIVSKILHQEDMPYYPDGQPIDMILNPLGVPSRMNVGQLFESLLGFVGLKLHKKFKILPFDESFGYEASRSLAFYQLYKTRKKLNQNWLFSPNYPSKFRLFDGRTGALFNHPIMAGFSYMMKLIHLVDEKIHARSTGSYSLVTQQPLRGRSKHGGQRFGEMEVWALEGFGVAYTLQELLTVKSDDVKGRAQIMETILKNSALRFGTPESFKVLIRELQALCLDVQIYNRNIKNYLELKKN
uniref:DNA-directed RNA polymerase subunit beta n=1 Tax=Ostreobium sp. HV05007bc TaxID=1940403 RepID=A0A1X9ZIH0_9CHLO|nr:RNA polymerase b-subunit [Ostreobium sp. HV05007bc]